MSADRLTAWMRGQLAASRSREPASRFELRHVPSGARLGHEVLALEPPDTEADAWCAGAAERIEEAAETYARGLRGTQRFALLVFRGDAAKPQGPRFPFVVEAEETGGYDSEPATSEGLAGQAMRHTEAMARMLIQSVGPTVNALQKTIDRLSARSEKLEARQLETIELIEELQTERHHREIAAAKADAQNKLMGELGTELKLLAPAIVNRLAGKNVIPLREDPTVLAWRRLFESLNDEQRAKMLELLDDKQKIALAEAARALQEKTG